ncbi:hypothetical protein [Kitasatospora sp. LaBMicrA B282]|uniref:hypothetical protein n=1 Tax=Kitasatospora sp. LaBMicrA B282 TaxID=3420949 RepID=UPI003D0D8458
MPDEKQRGARRIDLSVAQVAASALAAVVGAVLASELGVYGTIIGAAVVSIGATTGGAVFHHLFKRTGEQLREATDRSPDNSVNELQQVPLTDTTPLPAAWRAEPEGPGGAGAQWNDSGVFRARRRWSWKTAAAVSALVFVLAMTPILVVELATGRTVHSLTTGQDGGGTSIFPSGGEKHRDPAPQRPAGGERSTPSTGPSGSAGPGRPSTSPSATPTPTPSGSASGSPSAPPTGDPSTPTPTPTPSRSASGGATGAPSSAPPTGQAAQPSATPQGAAVPSP